METNEAVSRLAAMIDKQFRQWGEIFPDGQRAAILEALGSQLCSGDPRPLPAQAPDLT